MPVFALSGADPRGKVVLRKQLKRAQMLTYLAQCQPWVGGGGTTKRAAERITGHARLARWGIRSS